MFRLLAFFALIAAMATPAALSAATFSATGPVASSQSTIALEQQLVSVLQQLVQVLTQELSILQEPDLVSPTTSTNQIAPAAQQPTTSGEPAATAPSASSGEQAAIDGATSTNTVQCGAGYHECTGASCLHMGTIVTVPYYCITSSNPVSVTPLPAGAVWPSGVCLNAIDRSPTVVQASVDYFGNPLPGECVPDDPTSAI